MKLWQAILAGSFLTMAATSIAQDWLRQPAPGYEPLPAIAAPRLAPGMPAPPLTPEMPVAPLAPKEPVTPLATFDPVRSAVPAPVSSGVPIQSTWYTRIESFHANERFAHQSLLSENGPLVTLGYLRRVGNERFRGEFFDSSVRYKSFIERNDGTTEPLLSHTNYLGSWGVRRPVRSRLVAVQHLVCRDWHSLLVPRSSR
jgi:hypothetical protein